MEEMEATVAGPRCSVDRRLNENRLWRAATQLVWKARHDSWAYVPHFHLTKLEMIHICLRAPFKV
jgi:hypothetical protein